MIRSSPPVGKTMGVFWKRKKQDENERPSHWPPTILAPPVPRAQPPAAEEESAPLGSSAPPVVGAPPPMVEAPAAVEASEPPAAPTPPVIAKPAPAPAAASFNFSFGG